MKRVTHNRPRRPTSTDRKAAALLPDDAIIKKIIAGDTEAFRELVKRHQNMLIGVLTRILGEPQAAEETAQDTFVKAYLGLTGYRAESRFSTWLLQIGLNLARDRLRRRQRIQQKGIISLDALRQQQLDRWEPADRDTDADPLNRLSRRQEWELLQEALAALPDAYREVFTLRHLEGMEYAEMAEITGDTPGALKVRTHRARQRLRVDLEARGILRGLRADVDCAPATVTRKEE